MKTFLSILPFFLCLCLLLPTAYADEFTPAPQEPEASETPLEIPNDPYTSFDGSDTEPTEAPTESESPEETLPPETSPIESQDSNSSDEEAPTEPTETTTPVTEEPPNTDSDSLLQLLESVQNTEYATQLIAGFLLFFVICVLCFFSYRFFRIFI